LSAATAPRLPIDLGAPLSLARPLRFDGGGDLQIEAVDGSDAVEGARQRLRTDDGRSRHEHL